jgi:enoyl-CoA hydratase/carnithine racemase
MSDPISVDAGDVTTITVDRPEAMNALTTGTVEALRGAIREAEERQARVLVLTGAGDRAFIAGGDLSRMAELTPGEARDFAERGHELCDAIETFPAPVIAVINGHALGAGLELALACDLRVASERAVLGEPEVELGVIPGIPEDWKERDYHDDIDSWATASNINASLTELGQTVCEVLKSEYIDWEGDYESPDDLPEF